MFGKNVETGGDLPERSSAQKLRRKFQDRELLKKEHKTNGRKKLKKEGRIAGRTANNVLM